MKYLQRILRGGKTFLFLLTMTALLAPASMMGQRQSLNTEDAVYCEISYSLGDYYGDGWTGNAINVVDENYVIVTTLTIENGSSMEGTILLENEKTYRFVWVYGGENSYPDECSFTIIGADGSVILNVTAPAANAYGNNEIIATYTMSCNACRVPSNLAVANLINSSATVTWEPGGEETGWFFSYRNTVGEEILNESNWTSMPEGWIAVGLNEVGEIVPIEDWSVNNGTLVSNQESVLIIPVSSGVRAVITVQGSDEEVVFAGYFSGSLEVIDAYALVSAMQIMDNLTGSSQSINVDLSEYEGDGYLIIGHGCGANPANLYLEQLVVYDSEWSESILVTGTPSYTIENLESATTYQAKVVSICDENDYSNPAVVSFATMSCDIENQCPITYTLGDYYGDGWIGNNGAPNSAINVVDATNGTVYATLTFDDGYTYEGALPLCPGDYYFVWVSGSYDSECSFTFYGPEGEAFLSHEHGYAFPENGWLGAYAHACPTPLTFITDGSWDNPSNWDQNVVPQAVNNVVINAAAVIPANCVAEANYITIGSEGSLTIQDGGQLKHKNTGVVATVEKNIDSYTVANGYGQVGLTDGWYLIASPLASDFTPTEIMLSNTYDLFRFSYEWNETEDEWEMEWQNFKQNQFSTLTSMEGYLYSNSNDVMLQFTGEINPSIDCFTYPSEALKVTIPEDAIQLIGNPLVCNGYPIQTYYYYQGDEWWFANQPFYRMNESRTGLIVDEVNVNDEFVPVLPGEGIFVDNDLKSNVDIVFSPEPYIDNDGGSKGAITLNLTKNRGGVIDRAIVHFGEGPTLGKMMLNPNSTNICIPQGGEKYAVVHSANEGEMPVNFKAAENGNYTLNINVNNAELEYLHLVDNLTGADINLLETPSYSFNAKKTDYASRFKLVFKANQDGPGSETFAFFDGSIWTVSNIGIATLQVIDMMGRMLNSELIDGNAEINIQTAPGVYMLRLINGDNVKVQKIVVR